MLTESTWRDDPRFRALCKALFCCKTEEEMASMLYDIGTLSELEAWSERLEIAQLLARDLSYREVAKRTGTSTTTVTRVARSLRESKGGWKKIVRFEMPKKKFDALEALLERKLKIKSS